MEQVRIAEWLIEVDRARTHDIHVSRPGGAPEVCGCVDCRNLAAARHFAYPGQVRELLSALGIPLDRESQVSSLPQRLPSGSHSYTGAFHFIGRILVEPKAAEPTRYQVVCAPFGVLISSRRTHLLPEGFAGHPVVQLEFETEVPWVLNEPEPEQF